MTTVHSTGLRGEAAPQGVCPELLPDLAYTPEVARETAHLYERVSRVIPPIEWPSFAPYIKAINDLKRTRNAVVLAHNYMTPEIFHCVADVVGDSLQLAREASKTDAKIIVQGGVHFMAETSKLLNPDKMVLIPDSRAGCSLAASITGADVRALREAYPGVPVVTYVNTVRRGEGRVRHLLHLVQRGARGRVAGRQARDHDPGRISRQMGADQDRRRDHHLEGPLRGA